jgi:release factor glutamine methyltransferase
MTTIKESLQLAGLRIKEAGCANPALDAAVLLGCVIGESRTGLYRNWQQSLLPEAESRFFALVERRCAGEPVAYLTGEKEFMGLSFAVNPSVLIPRPETEMLVERAIGILGGAATVVIDVGTGSGAIGVSVAVHLPKSLVYAIDISADAIKTARQNARSHGVEQRVNFRQGDLLKAVEEDGLTGGVDLIAANLPYVATGDLADLPLEVRGYEPREALIAGLDGMDLYRQLIPQAVRFLKPGGILIMEIGYDQRETMAVLLPEDVWQVSFERDLAGLDRLVTAVMRWQK